MKRTGTVILAIFMALSAGCLMGCGASDKVAVQCPAGTVWLCDDGIAEYLRADAGVDVSGYYVNGETAGKPVEILWGSTLKGLLGYTLEYATDKDYKNSVKIELPEEQTWYDLTNLYKDTTYYVRVWAHNGDKKYYNEGSFTTSAVGPRVMTIDGIYNTRDIGGSKTAGGKRFKQGMVYRGSALNDEEFGIYITRAGKKYMKETLGIRSELSLLGGPDGVSAIDSSVPMYSFTVSGYADAFVPKEDGKQDFTSEYRALFSRLAKPETYPTYIHCQGGADRTGTACYLLAALLGVGERDLVHDYEFTTFSMISMVGARSTVSGLYADYYKSLVDNLQAFEGDSLMKKTENYLLSIGVTAEEIASIRSILLA